MSKGNRVVQVRLIGEMVDAIFAELEKRNNHTAKEIWNPSDWIRAAIQEKLKHSSRCRGRKQIRKYQCVHCGLKFTSKEIAFVTKPLFGKKEYECVSCVRVQPTPL